MSVKRVRTSAKPHLTIDGDRGLDIAVVTPVGNIKNENSGALNLECLVELVAALHAASVRFLLRWGGTIVHVPNLAELGPSQNIINTGKWNSENASEFVYSHFVASIVLGKVPTQRGSPAVYLQSDRVICCSGGNCGE